MGLALTAANSTSCDVLNGHRQWVSRTEYKLRWLQAIEKLLKTKKSLVAVVRFELTQHAGSKQVEALADFPAPNWGIHLLAI
jgi:hypothetical protein